MTPNIKGRSKTTIVNCLLDRPHTPEQMMRILWDKLTCLSDFQKIINRLVKEGYEIEFRDGMYHLEDYPALCCLTPHQRSLVHRMPFSVDEYPNNVSYKTATNQMSEIRQRLKPFGMTIRNSTRKYQLVQL